MQPGECIVAVGGFRAITSRSGIVLKNYLIKATHHVAPNMFFYFLAAWEGSSV